jgi:hypothetical protein
LLCGRSRLGIAEDVIVTRLNTDAIPGKKGRWRLFCVVSGDPRRQAPTGEWSVKLIPALLLGLCLLPMAASAQNMNADDVKWINQCIGDNQGEPGVTPAIVRAYCVCMNEKMDNNESQSITRWEKSHPEERKACDKQAGWR